MFRQRGRGVKPRNVHNYTTRFSNDVQIGVQDKSSNYQRLSTFDDPWEHIPIKQESERRIRYTPWTTARLLTRQLLLKKGDRAKIMGQDPRYHARFRIKGVLRSGIWPTGQGMRDPGGKRTGPSYFGDGIRSTTHSVVDLCFLGGATAPQKRLARKVPHECYLLSQLRIIHVFALDSRSLGNGHLIQWISCVPGARGKDPVGLVGFTIQNGPRITT